VCARTSKQAGLRQERLGSRTAGRRPSHRWCAAPVPAAPARSLRSPHTRWLRTQTQPRTTYGGWRGMRGGCVRNKALAARREACVQRAAAAAQRGQGLGQGWALPAWGQARAAGVAASRQVCLLTAQTPKQRAVASAAAQAASQSRAPAQTPACLHHAGGQASATGQAQFCSLFGVWGARRAASRQHARSAARGGAGTSSKYSQPKAQASQHGRQGSWSKDSRSKARRAHRRKRPAPRRRRSGSAGAALRCAEFPQS
jgi:hypothetical protein